MFCPNCRCEYRPGFTECADCRVPLVDELPVKRECCHASDLGAAFAKEIRSNPAAKMLREDAQAEGIPEDKATVPLILAVGFALFFVMVLSQPWYIGVFWSTAAFKVFNIPADILTLVRGRPELSDLQRGVRSLKSPDKE